MKKLMAPKVASKNDLFMRGSDHLSSSEQTQMEIDHSNDTISVRDSNSDEQMHTEEDEISQPKLALFEDDSILQVESPE